MPPDIQLELIRGLNTPIALEKTQIGAIQRYVLNAPRSVVDESLFTFGQQLGLHDWLL
jgi:hypothetical protein